MISRSVSALLGNTEGSGSSEAVVTVLGLLAGVGVCLTGHVEAGAEIIAYAVVGYNGARGVTKGVGEFVRSREAARAAQAERTP